MYTPSITREVTPEAGPGAFWGDTTNPARHDPLRFRYLVHMDYGVRPDNIHGTRLIAENPSLKGRYYIDNLAALAMAEVVSGSLIDQTHQKTFRGRMGLILHVPAEDVIVASERDVYSSYSDRLWAAIHTAGVVSPDELLARSRGYNEVVFSGDNAQVAGVVYFDGDWHNKRGQGPTIDRAQAGAQALDVPLVRLTPPTQR
jgi:hypothetical protein